MLLAALLSSPLLPITWFVQELDLYIDPHSSHFSRPSKHTHIALQPTSESFSLHYLTVLGLWSPPLHTLRGYIHNYVCVSVCVRRYLQN